MSYESFESRQRRYYRNPKKAIDTARQWKLDNRVYVIWKSAKDRAKDKDLPFSITEEDIVLPEICPVLNRVIDYNAKGRANPNSPSLDRIDNSQGYTKENICIISGRANTLKGDGTLEELERIVEYMKSKRNENAS